AASPLAGCSTDCTASFPAHSVSQLTNSPTTIAANLLPFPPFRIRIISFLPRKCLRHQYVFNQPFELLLGQLPPVRRHRDSRRRPEDVISQFIPRQGAPVPEARQIDRDFPSVIRDGMAARASPRRE